MSYGDGTTSDISSSEHALIVGGVTMALSVMRAQGSPIEWTVTPERTSNGDFQPFMTLRSMGKAFLVTIEEVVEGSSDIASLLR